MQRITAEEALEHPFVEQFHDPAQEPACEFIIQIAISDDQKLSIKEYRDALYKDVIAGSRRHRKSKTGLSATGASSSSSASGSTSSSTTAADKEKKDRKGALYMCVRVCVRARCVCVD